KEGAKVAIVDLNDETGQEAIRELQQYQLESMFIQANLAEHDRLTGIVDQIEEKYGRLDILVNNAHASKNRPFFETGQVALGLSFYACSYPTFYLLQAAIPRLKET